MPSRSSWVSWQKDQSCHFNQTLNFILLDDESRVYSQSTFQLHHCIIWTKPGISSYPSTLFNFCSFRLTLYFCHMLLDQFMACHNIFLALLLSTNEHVIVYHYHCNALAAIFKHCSQINWLSWLKCNIWQPPVCAVFGLQSPSIYQVGWKTSHGRLFFFLQV